MDIIQVNGSHKDFESLCRALEEFQYNLLPVLKENEDYILTDNLDSITGLILYINKKPVGSIGLKAISKDTCEIVRVFVHSEHRGNGYAKILFEKIESLAKKLGYKKAEMVAWCEAKPALSLYKKLGYTFSEEKISEWYGGNKYVELYKTLD